jgi:hypothetical protein
MYLESYHLLYHAQVNGDVKLTLRIFQIAFPVFLASKKRNYVRLTADFLISYHSWSERLRKLISGVMYCPTSTGIHQPTDSEIESFNLHGKNRNFDCDKPNFGANISANTFQAVNSINMIAGLNNEREKSTKYYESDWTKNQKRYVDDMTALLNSYWSIITDPDILFCNFMNEEPKPIASTLIDEITEAIRKCPETIEKRKGVFQSKVHNIKNEQKKTILLDLNEEYEIEKEMREFAKIKSRNTDEETQDDMEEASDEISIIPDSKTIVGKFAGWDHLKKSKQRTRSERTTEEKELENAKKRVLENIESPKPNTRSNKRKKQ